jgi:L-arabinokinase
MIGAEFLAAYKSTDDPLTIINPDQAYPVRAATRFPIGENARAHRAREIFSHYAADPKASAAELRDVLKTSHDGYSAMGLGSPETDTLVQSLLEEPSETGFIGGRISGGGSGGTVVVLLEKRAEERLREMVTRHCGGAIIV